MGDAGAVPLGFFLAMLGMLAANLQSVAQALDQLTTYRTALRPIRRSLG